MTKYDDFKPRIQALESVRTGVTSRIKMYKYYTRGLVGDKIPAVTQTKLKGSSLLWGFDRSLFAPKDVDELDIYPIKCDTSAESITADGTSAFVSACLPEGINSIEVEFFDAKYKNYLRLNPAQRNMIADIGGIVTKNIQYVLKKPEYYFVSKIQSAIANYIEFGFTVVKLDSTDKNPLSIINFDPELTYFDFEVGGNNETPTVFLLGERANDEEIKRKYPKFEGKGSKTGDEISNENIVWYYYYCDSDGSWTYFVYDDTYKETLDFKTKCPPPKLYLANRETKSGCYGVGDGIAALSSIITINETSEGIRRAVKIITNPPIILDERAHSSYITETGEVRDGVDVKPGATTSVRPATESTAAKDSIALAFGGNPIEVAPLYQIMEGAKAELKQAFSADLFSNNVNPSTEQTATEINTRTSQALHRFKGKANNFYSGLLIPLLKETVVAQIAVQFDEKDGPLTEKLVKSQLFTEELMREIPGKYTIKILSFGDQLSKDRDIANSLQQLQILMGLQQTQQADAEVKEGISKASKTILEDLNKSAGV